VNARTRSPSVRALVVAFLLLALPGVAAGQALEELYTRDAPIPTRYKSWTLFLICSTDWVLPQSKERLTDLYYRFRAFGQNIGADHAAVWFWIRRPQWPTDAVVDNVDVERSVAYCQRLNLPPSAGPYVYFTAVHPDAATAESSRFTLALNGKSSAEIATILAGLSDQLLLQGVPRTPTDSEAFWRGVQRSYEGLQGTLGALLARVTLSISTPWFKVELKD